MNIPVPARIALVAGVAVVLAGGLFLVFGGTDTGPDIDAMSRTDAEAQDVAGRKAVPKGQPTAKAPERGPDGRPIVGAPRNQRKRALLEQTPDDKAPYEATDWDSKRAKAAEEWHTKTNYVATEWLKEFPKDKQHDAILALKTYTNNVMETREQGANSRMTRDELRERLVDHRLDVEDELTRILGERGADQLNEHLSGSFAGGGW